MDRFSKDAEDDIGGAARDSDADQPEGTGQAVNVLRGLLELSQLTRLQVPLENVLEAIAQILGRDLGFDGVELGLYRVDSDDYVVRAVHAAGGASSRPLGTVTPASDRAALFDDRYQHHGAFLVPAHGSDPADVRWHDGDALVVPLLGTNRRRLGVVSVDHPRSGLRPDDAQLEQLAVFAAHVALAIESARQLRELEAALSRNRAVLATTLECVIGVDERGHVIEFNPAAERTFGYTKSRVLGRPLGELLVAPEDRDAVRARFTAGVASGRGEMLGRRSEFTAMRADGSTIEIEYAFARLPGDGAEGPVYYGFARDISDRRRNEARLAFLAYHDPLTGLPNRAEVEREIGRALARAARSGTSVGLMFVDLDDFKAVNDRYGHVVGDRFLVEVATRLSGVLRDSDVLARQGGDEFLVLLADLPDQPAESALAVANKLLAALAQPFVIGEHQLNTRASIGISLYPQDATDMVELLRHSDSAMYEVKGAGGDGAAHHHGPPASSDSTPLERRRRTDPARRL